MKFAFLVQGEGRGHMTQAITMRQLLQEAGHQVVFVVVGTSKFRQIPNFFYEKINAPVHKVESPNFVRDKKDVGIKLSRTITYNMARARHYFASLKQINQLVQQHQPDVILNFYELLCGLYYFFYNPKAMHITIGHQYLHHHPNFESPPNSALDRRLLLGNNGITAYKAKLRLALSFSEFSNISKPHTIVVPPLLRASVLQAQPTTQNYILAYLLNPGYAEQLKAWKAQNPETDLHVFWDKKDAPETLEVQPGLTFHRLNDVLFIDKLTHCKGYMSTAGFESVCEAMYLGKPVFMVPTAGHYEQACNLVDARNHGAGIGGPAFDLDAFLQYLPTHKANTDAYRAWVNSAAQRYSKIFASLQA